MDKTEYTGMMISLTGLLFIIPLFFYSTYLHTRKMRVKKNYDAFYNIMLTWLIICYYPMTIEYQSTIMGDMVFGFLFTLLGFKTMVFGLGVYLGWEDKPYVLLAFFTSSCCSL